MAIRAHAQAEPIPGYRLIERLGAGGFGEVWKAEAPGGLLKAIKFVHGTLHSAMGDETAVQQELKSLSRVKSVRHPYILSLERYDIVDGQLMIVMELADKTLFDRLGECTKQGLPGIPREELLRYMEEAAEALDLMNIQYGLQHLDIKPQNLFLVHNHVKVADFGLVKDLEGMNTQVTGGVTPLYAAPETFDGVITRYCDQYNLAIVYQELLTGQRPFSGTSVRQLLMQHLTGQPELKALPAGDQPVIGRSLSKKPEDRYPTCSEMVQALREAGIGLSVLRKEQPRQAAPVLVPPNNEARPSNTNTPPVPSLVPSSPPVRVPSPSFVPMQTMAALPERRIQPRQEITGDGVLFPALVIGVGGLGLKVLQMVRKGLSERSGPAAQLPHIQLLYVETDPQAAQQALSAPADIALTEQEIILARLNKPSHYLRPGRERMALDAWLNMNMLCRLPRNQTSVDGLRLLGRLALADNYRNLITKVKADLTSCASTSALTSADRHTRLGVRTSRPRVYVVTSLGGGTGGGMFIDLAYLVRRQLLEIGVADPEVVGLLLLPAAGSNARKNPVLVNAFAALTELEHFSSSKTTYTNSFDQGEDVYRETDTPFRRCIMVPLPEEGPDPTPTEELLACASDFLCRDLLTPLGRSADEVRCELPKDDETSLTCQAFGSFRFTTPRRVLIERVGRSLAHNLLHNWLTTHRSLGKAVRARLAEQTAQRQLTPEDLIAALQAACAQSLGTAPETRFESIIHQQVKGGDTPDPNDVFAAIQKLEEIIGQPQEEDSAESVSTPMVEALDEAARTLRKDWENQYLELVRSLIDEPKFRVVGAEEAGQQLTTMLEEVIERQQALLQDLYTRAEDAYLAVDSLVANLRKGSWWPGRKAKVADELRQALEQYPKSRYQSMVLESLVEVYQKLLEKLPKRLEEIRFCRDRLTEAVRALDDQHDPDRRPPKLGPGRHFLPDNSPSLEEAVETLLRSVKPEDLAALDEQIQDVVRKQFQSLAAVCMASEDVFAEFQEAVLQRTEGHVESLLSNASVAAVYLQQFSNEREIVSDLTSVCETATPVLPGRRYSGAEIRFVVAPDDAAGDRLGKLVKSACPDTEVVVAKGGGEVYFYRERPFVPVAELPQLGLMAEEVYKQMTASGQFTPHTRTDIGNWLKGG